MKNRAMEILEFNWDIKLVSLYFLMGVIICSPIILGLIVGPKAGLAMGIGFLTGFTTRQLDGFIPKAAFFTLLVLVVISYQYY